MGRPNILWIVTTQWRAQALGSAGDPNAHTPWLDALAEESVNFTQAVTPHPFGPFARAALLTGVPSPANGLRGYFDPLPAGTRTIAHDLRERGYATAFFGKWHLGRRDPATPLVGRAAATKVVPLEERGGFECWEGFDGGFMLNDPWLHGTRLSVPVEARGYQSDVLCGRAGDWIRSRPRVLDPGAAAGEPAGRPWFCVVSLEAPHPPYDAPAAGVRAREPGEIVLASNVPRGGDTEVRARRELAGYYTHIEATDRAVGKLIGAMPRNSAQGRPQTIIVFTSAHGDMHGAHGLFRKGWPHEESVRVPLLVRGLRRKGADAQDAPARGERREDAVSLLDLPAMTREWAVVGGDLPARVLTHAKISMPSAVPLPHQCDRAWRGVRTKTRKLVLGTDEAGPPWAFFDLEQDPGETKNLARDPGRADEVAELTALAVSVSSSRR
jgi:arylsulfatase A-like enzyme